MVPCGLQQAKMCLQCMEGSEQTMYLRSLIGTLAVHKQNDWTKQTVSLAPDEAPFVAPALAGVQVSVRSSIRRHLL